jgi:ATP-binding cassette, subfamily B, bacterial
MNGASVKRDRMISREVHRLLWRGLLSTYNNLIICYATRTPAQFLYNVVIPFQVAFGIQAIFTRQFAEVSHYALTIILLGFAYGVLWTVGGIAICRGGIISGSYVQKAVFENYLSKDYEFYSSNYLGALSTQANRIRDISNEYAQLIVNGIPRQLLIVVAGVIIIGMQSIPLALITLLCMSIVLSYTLASSRWRLRFRRKLSVANSDLGGVIGDALGHSDTVKTFASEDYETMRLDIALKRWGKVQYNSWLSSIPADVGQAVLASITLAILLVLTGRLYQDNSISIAVVALVQLYVLKMIGSAQEIAELYKTYENIMGAAHQTVKTMFEPTEIMDPLKPIHISKSKVQEIRFNNVTFAYPSAKDKVFAVNNFNFTIKSGEKIGLVGYSGSGKTTLTKLLVRFIDVSSGSILVDAVDIRDTTQKELRTLVSYVPQEPLLFHRSIAENIGYGKPAASMKQIEAAAKAAYVNEFIDELPQGYETLVGERGVKLSGGQRQRVAIARAILKDSPILVLDEATSALDSRSEKLVQEALWKLMNNRTALVIAHRLSTIQRMDRIVVMDKGQISQIGTHLELIKKSGIYADLWSHQSGGYIGAP